jgi:centrosomal protein CEP164
LLCNEKEILEYAKYLGMDPYGDKDLLYIAKEGLKAPLPENWKPCKTREGDIYYFNFATSQSQWEHPCDEFYKKKYAEAKSKKAQK